MKEKREKESKQEKKWRNCVKWQQFVFLSAENQVRKSTRISPLPISLLLVKWHIPNKNENKNKQKKSLQK